MPVSRYLVIMMVCAGVRLVEDSIAIVLEGSMDYIARTFTSARSVLSVMGSAFGKFTA